MTWTRPASPASTSASSTPSRRAAPSRRCWYRGGPSEPRTACTWPTPRPATAGMAPKQPSRRPAGLATLAAAAHHPAASRIRPPAASPSSPPRSRPDARRLGYPPAGRHLLVGDPKGITNRDAGSCTTGGLRTWRRTHLMGAITDKAHHAGITVARVDERGTSSTCPRCGLRFPNPPGVTSRVRTVDTPGIATSSPPTTSRENAVEPSRPAPGSWSTVASAPRPSDVTGRRHHMDQRRSCRPRAAPATSDGSRSQTHQPARINQPRAPTAQTLADGALGRPAQPRGDRRVGDDDELVGELLQRRGRRLPVPRRAPSGGSRAPQA